MSGKFITIEGPDGAGKTTNVKILVGWLQDRGYDVVYTREPGGTPLGEQIRGILLNQPMAPMTEIMMFCAARAEHLEQLIRPSLKQGKIVICDRFSDSTYAYQAAGRGWFKEVEIMENVIHGNFEPDHTLFFNVTLEESMRRLHERTGGKLDVFEQEKKEFRERVYQGYQVRFKHKQHRMVLIDAMQTPEEVAAQVIAWAEKTFG